MSGVENIYFERLHKFRTSIMQRVLDTAETIDAYEDMGENTTDLVSELEFLEELIKKDV